jgi:hypothetical protein
MNCRLVLACGAILLLFSSLSYAQERREKDYELAMTLGVFQLETGEYQNAVENFKRALGLKPKDQPATMSLGVAYSRSGDYGRAREVLLKAQALDKSDARTRYELGVALYKLGDMPGAKAQFASIDQGTADATLKDAAGDYLDLIASGLGQENKKFSIDVLTGFQYDSNVILDPDNPIVPGKTKSGWRFLAAASGKYRFIDDQKKSADAGYAFYQSLHIDNNLSDFNVQQHSLSLSGRHKASEKTRFDLRYGFTYAFVGGDKYGAIHKITPSATFGFTPQSATEFFYAFELKDYYNSGLFPANSDRSGNNNAVGVTHTVLFPGQTSVAISYAYDKDSADQAFWSYSGNKGSVSVQGKLPFAKATASVSYYDKRYDGEVPGYAQIRHDGTQEYSVTLSRNIIKNINLSLSDSYTRNESTIAPFEYTRNIVSLLGVMPL